MEPIGTDQVREGILFLIALVMSISVHEFGHAWAADKLGDPTPKAQGRLTMSPMSHVDPIGTLLFPMISFFSAMPLLGWGRPVMTHPGAYTRKVSARTGMMLVSIAGPLMNLLMALLVSGIIIAGVRSGVVTTAIGLTLIQHLVTLNLSLMFFNMLPMPPLDGGAVLAWVLPQSLDPVLGFFQKWGFLILLGLVMTGFARVIMYPAYLVTKYWIGVVMMTSGMGTGL